MFAVRAYILIDNIKRQKQKFLYAHAASLQYYWTTEEFDTSLLKLK